MTEALSPVQARIRNLRRISPIWLVPIVAAVIGLWLVYATLSNQGPLVTLTMSNAEGIEAGKTMIKARSVEVGMVQTVKLSEDLTHVIVTARMAVDTEDLLRQDSQLWVVKPRIERQGISGLSTLLSGSYIELLPGKSEKRRSRFSVLDAPPIAQADERGLRVRLTSQGFLRPCLASEAGCDLKALLRSGASDEELLTAIRTTIWEKPQEHHFELKQDIPATRGMYRIGG